MRRTLYAFVALALFSAVSCTKDDENIDNVPDKGAVRFVNASSGERYDIFLDDYHYGDLLANDAATYPNIVVGYHKVKAQQIDVRDGSTPKLREQVVQVQKDSIATFVFP